VSDLELVNLATIRQGIATYLFGQLNPLQPTTVVINVFTYAIPGVPAPSITLQPPAGDYVSYFETMGPKGETDVFLDAIVDTGATRSEDAQMLLDDVLGIATPLSIASAFWRDRTCGGVVASCVPLKSVGGNEENGWVARVPLTILTRKGGN